MRMTASWSGPHGPTEYKVVARCSVPDGKLPSDRRPDRVKRAAVLEAVKAWPGQGEHAERLVRRPTLTTPARAAVSKGRVGTKKRL